VVSFTFDRNDDKCLFDITTETLLEEFSKAIKNRKETVC